MIIQKMPYPIVVAPTDPEHWAYVVLQEQYTGLGIDESRYGQVREGSGGNIALSNGSLVLDGSGPGGHAAWNNDRKEFNPTNKDFTFEFFGVVFNSTGDCTLAGQEQLISASSGRCQWNIYRRSGQWIVTFSVDGLTKPLQLTAAQALTVSVPYDVAIERSGSTWRLYVNGMMLAKATASIALYDFITTPRIGARLNLGAYDDFFSGSLKAVRWTVGAARYNSDAGYTVPSLPLPQGSTGIAGQRAAPGAWTWFNDPRAISYASGSKLAFTGMTRRTNLDLFEASAPFTNFTRTQLDPDNWTQNGAGNVPSDDHNNAGLLRRADGKLMAFWTEHSISNVGYYYSVSGEADSGASFGAINDIDPQLGGDRYTYALPFQMTGEANSPLHLIFREHLVDGYAVWRRSTSTNNGANWAAPITFLDAGGGDYSPYLKAVQSSPTRIDFVCTDGHPSYTPVVSIYHFYYENGTYYDTDGTPLTLPINPVTALSPLYDGTITPAWIWDIQINADGYPVIAYTNFPTVDDHRYRRLEYNGTSWVDEQIVSANGGGLYAGEPHYTGGICFDPANTNVVYCSIKDGFGIYQMWKFTKGGGAWSGVKLTSGIRPSIRPFVVPGTNRLLYLNGVYNSQFDWHTHICIHDIG